MNVNQFNEALEQNPNSAIEFVLPSGERIPPHFHVTEVGRVDRSFIDCGGTKRASSSCLIQLWAADDMTHRLLPSKLGKIMLMAAPTLQSETLPVEVEYGELIAAQYSVDHFESVFGKLRFMLMGKRTDCLAKDKCGVEGCNTPGCCSTSPAEGARPALQGNTGCSPTC